MFKVVFSQSDSIVDFGQNLINENRLNIATSYYNKHLIEPKNTEQSVHLLLGLAEVYKLQLDYSRASEYYERAFEQIKRTKNPQLDFLYHVKMAEFYRKRTLFDEALDQLEKADEILKDHPIDDKNLARFYNRKAALFTEYFYNPDSTLMYAEKSLKLSKAANDKDNIFYSTLEISGAYEERNQYNKALEYLQELIEYSKTNNLIQHQADAYINYTRVLIKDKQFKKALNESLNALEFAKRNNLLFNEILFTDNIRNIHEELGNINKAYQYLKIRLDLTDKYYQKEHSEYLFELEEKYKLAEKDNQIKINNLKIENQNKALASNKINLDVSIALFVFAIVVAILIAFFLRRTRQSNKKLQLLSQENEFLLSEANHRINNNLQLVVILISDQMKKMSDQNSFYLKNILTKVEAISTLHKHLYKNNDKNKVDAFNYLNDVRIGFFDVFKENDIYTNFKIASIEIPTDYAMYLGLLLTELCINSVKYAFEDLERKEINFELSHTGKLLYFNYSDNGKLVTNKLIEPKLIDKLCRQLKINYKIETERGFSFSFEKEFSDE